MINRHRSDFSQNFPSFRNMVAIEIHSLVNTIPLNLIFGYFFYENLFHFVDLWFISRFGNTDEKQNMFSWVLWCVGNRVDKRKRVNPLCFFTRQTINQKCTSIDEIILSQQYKINTNLFWLDSNCHLNCFCWFAVEKDKLEHFQLAKGGLSTFHLSYQNTTPEYYVQNQIRYWQIEFPPESRKNIFLLNNNYSLVSYDIKLAVM